MTRLTRRLNGHAFAPDDDPQPMPPDVRAMLLADDDPPHRTVTPADGRATGGGWPAATSTTAKIGGSLQTLPDPWDAGWITMAELEAADVTTTYHVERLIPADEPMIVGAPAKGMKTSLVADALLCASSGETFGDFGEDQQSFAVPTPVRCGFVSCESGYAALKKTFSAIAKSRGRTIGEYTDLFLRAEKYDLCSPATHVQIARLVTRQKIRILALDPTFLLFAGMGDDASNIFRQGAALEPLTRISRDYGVTIMPLHHFSRGAVLNGVGRKPDLSWLSYAGFDAWARAWWLITRREEYSAATPGIHRLSLIAGGSAGHSEDLALDLDEGFPFCGRTDPPGYSLRVRYAADVEAEAEEAGEDEKIDRGHARKEKTAIRNAGRLLTLLERTGGPVTMSMARSGTGVNLDATDVRTAMARLVQSGDVVETTTKAGNGRDIQAWQIPASGTSGTSGTFPDGSTGSTAVAGAAEPAEPQ